MRILMPHAPARLFSLALAIMMALWTPVCCCNSADAAESGGVMQVQEGEAVPALVRHDASHHGESVLEKDHSPGSHCPGDTSDADCPHLQPVLSVADGALVAPSGVFAGLHLSLQALPLSFITAFDAQQKCLAARWNVFVTPPWACAGTLRAQHVLLLI